MPEVNMPSNQSMVLIPLETSMPEWGYYAASIALCLIGIFGCAFNLCAILIMLKNKKVWINFEQSIIHICLKR